MGVHTHFSNFIVPIEKIENSGFKGGFKKFINQFTSDIGSSIFFDKHIVNFMDGPFGSSYRISEFCEEYGLEGVVEGKDGPYWKDYCILSSFGGIFEDDAKCDWIERSGKIAYLKGSSMCPSYPECGKASYYRSFRHKGRADYFGMGFM